MEDSCKIVLLFLLVLKIVKIYLADLGQTVVGFLGSTKHSLKTTARIIRSYLALFSHIPCASCILSRLLLLVAHFDYMLYVIGGQKIVQLMIGLSSGRPAVNELRMILIWVIMYLCNVSSAISVLTFETAGKFFLVPLHPSFHL